MKKEANFNKKNIVAGRYLILAAVFAAVRFSAIIGVTNPALDNQARFKETLGNVSLFNVLIGKNIIPKDNSGASKDAAKILDLVKSGSLAQAVKLISDLVDSGKVDEAVKLSQVLAGQVKSADIEKLYDFDVTQLYAGEAKDDKLLKQGVSEVKLSDINIPAIKDIEGYKVLNLSDLSLTTLDGISKLTVKDSDNKEKPITEIDNLELQLNNNKLTTLPGEIGLLKNLKWLEVNNNVLQELPDEIGELNKLRVLDLKNNRLTKLPGTLKNLNLLNIVNFSGNSDANISQIDGFLKLRDYLR